MERNPTRPLSLLRPPSHRVLLKGRVRSAPTWNCVPFPSLLPQGNFSPCFIFLLRLHFPPGWWLSLALNLHPAQQAGITIGVDPSRVVPTAKYRSLLQALPGLSKVLNGMPQIFPPIFAFSIRCGWGGGQSSNLLVQSSAALWPLAWPPSDQRAWPRQLALLKVNSSYPIYFYF